MTDGQEVAKIVLTAHRDDIQGKIDKLWKMDDKSLESIERHKLEHMLNKVNEALEWAKGIDKEVDTIEVYKTDEEARIASIALGNNLFKPGVSGFLSQNIKTGEITIQEVDS